MTETTAEAGELKCPGCHYHLENLTSNRCPECGQHFEIVSPLVTRVGPAPYDWRYWGSMAAWAVGIVIYLVSWVTQDIFWFNFGTGFMVSLITLVVIGKR